MMAGVAYLVRECAGCAKIYLVLGGLALAGCALMPASGPSSLDVVPPVPDSRPYAFVKLTREVADNLAQYTPRLANAFTDRRPPQDFHFGVGDIVSVTIFEAAAGGLFIPAEAGVRPGNF